MYVRLFNKRGDMKKKDKGKANVAAKTTTTPATNTEVKNILLRVIS